MSTHALMSDAPADSAATQPPMLRPPRKYSFSPSTMAVTDEEIHADADDQREIQ